MQILNRISKIFKANINQSDSGSYSFNNEDEELKRIIDELNSEKVNNKERNQNRENYSSSPLSKYYNILGLSPNSTIDDIKNNYKKLMKEYHPDRFAKFDDNTRKNAERKSQEINEAYTKIRKERGF
ncbi:MAG: J domain-containing protein [Candidatus Kapabacteria bacterium]|nr:J domain-containing protein [Ignavibacteriota bacterium]MCW5885467.1 J domain-containing protein [Candidatus Kapabacteria bacterium]